MRNLVLGLSLSVAFIVGCVAGPVILPRSTAAPTGAAPAGTQKWEYTCFQHHIDRAVGIDGGKIKRMSNKAGPLGWEMVSGIVYDREAVYCFKRRLP